MINKALTVQNPRHVRRVVSRALHACAVHVMASDHLGLLCMLTLNVKKRRQWLLFN